MSNQPTQEDLNHLHLLAIFHYVLGGLIGLTGCFPFLHVAMGLMMVKEAESKGGSDAATMVTFGMFFVVFAVAIIIMLWAMAVCTLLAGRFLQQQRHYVYCIVIAGLLCMFMMPLGTVLGVFTIIVLMRPTVKPLFEAKDVVLSDSAER